LVEGSQAREEVAVDWGGRGQIVVTRVTDLLKTHK